MRTSAAAILTACLLPLGCTSFAQDDPTVTMVEPSATMAETALWIEAKIQHKAGGVFGGFEYDYRDVDVATCHLNYLERTGRGRDTACNVSIPLSDMSLKRTRVIAKLHEGFLAFQSRSDNPSIGKTCFREASSASVEPSSEFVVETEVYFRNLSLAHRTLKAVRHLMSLCGTPVEHEPF